MAKSTFAVAGLDALTPALQALERSLPASLITESPPCAHFHPDTRISLGTALKAYWQPHGSQIRELVTILGNSGFQDAYRIRRTDGHTATAWADELTPLTELDLMHDLAQDRDDEHATALLDALERYSQFNYLPGPTLQYLKHSWLAQPRGNTRDQALAALVELEQAYQNFKE